MIQAYNDERDISSDLAWLETGKLNRIRVSRVNVTTYSSDNPNARFKTQVEGSHGTWYTDIPVDDFRQLFNIYQPLPHEGLNLNPVDFVFGINSRIYTEWCMSPGEGASDWRIHRDYQGEGFTDFIAKEVHYELERARSEQDRGSHEGYLRVRQRVLGGLALRAIELFTEWGGKSRPHGRAEKDPDTGSTKYICEDSRNLRGLSQETGLNDYITRYCQLREQRPAII